VSIDKKKNINSQKRGEEKKKKKKRALTLRNQLEPNLTRKPTTTRVGVGPKKASKCHKITTGPGPTTCSPNPCEICGAIFSGPFNHDGEREREKKLGGGRLFSWQDYTE
jgi:hypothetical protein